MDSQSNLNPQKRTQPPKLSKEEAVLEEQILQLATASDVDYQELEKLILASAKAQVDYNQVVNALSVSDSKLQLGQSTSSSVDEFFAAQRVPTSTWQVSVAASVAFSLLAHFLFDANWVVSSTLGALVFCVAYADPVDDDNLLGAVARMVGRETLQSYQTTVEPKARAIARAALTSEAELEQLQTRLHELERENAQLKRWKEVRLQAEDHLSEYTLTELKTLARDKELPVGGTKLQLFVRLLESHALAIPEQQQQNGPSQD